MFDFIIEAIRWYAVAGSAVIAAIYFTFSFFVMRALERIDAPRGISAMQSINVTIVMPPFLLALMGTTVASIVLVAHSLFSLDERASILALIGGLFYLVGSMFVTFAFNIPRNNTLEALDPDVAASADTWATFVREWTNWNHVRTVATIVSTVFFILSVMG